MERTKTSLSSTDSNAAATPIHLYGGSIKIIKTGGDETYLHDVEEVLMVGSYKKKADKSRYTMDGGSAMITKSDGSKMQITDIAELHITDLY